MNRSSDHRDLERELSDWLHAAAPSPAPDLADRLLRRTAATRQRRRWSGWSFMVPALGGAALAVVMLFVGIQLWKIGPEPIEPLATPPPGVETPTVLAETPAPSEPGPSPVVPSPSPVVPSPSPETTPPPTEPSPSPDGEVFPDGQSCHNDSIGYTVSYPAGWWAQEEIPPTAGDRGVRACIAFAPTETDILDRSNGESVPAIYFYVDKNTQLVGERVRLEETTVDGHPATIRELLQHRDLYYPAGTRTYQYLIDLGDGTFLVVDTVSGMRTGGVYARDVKVIDKMMQTLRFDP